MTAPVRETPAWLLRPQVGLCSCACAGKRRRTGFLEATLQGAADALRRVFASDDAAARPGFLQRADPRAKLVAFGGLILVTALVHNVFVIAAVCIATVVTARLSGLRVSTFVRRVLMFVPLFTAVVVLPATLNVVTPGDVIVPLGTLFGHQVGITEQGAVAAALIVARVSTSIALVVLLTMTTSWNRLLVALRSLRLPRVFVMVAMMTYCYIFQLLDALTEMFTARKARCGSAVGHGAGGRRFVAASTGALFGKTQSLADEVHMAMVARGFDGDVRSLAPLTLRLRDVLLATSALVAALLVMGVDRAFGH